MRHKSLILIEAWKQKSSSKPTCLFYGFVDSSVPSRVGNLRKMRNFWANFTDFEPKINITKCKTEKLKQKTWIFLCKTVACILEK